MRPIKITIKGINSYVSEQVVNFEKVSENKLFGIFGETGSGKTTILDCIVMALYGTSERDSMQNVINVNSTDSYIIFDFEMFYEGENRRYKVERYYRQQKNGIIKSTAMFSSLDTNSVLADKQEDVNIAIQKIIGVGKKEFLKCIAIPQGEFDAFLCETPINRKKTISKLFNLEHFGVALQEKLKNRKNLYTNKKITTEEKLAIYNNINDFNLNALELEMLDKEKTKIDTEFKLNTEKTKNIILISDFDNLQKLNSSKESLDKLLQNKEEIDFARKQVEYTNSYGNFLAVNDKHKTITAEINAKKADVDELKEELAITKTSLSKEDSHLKEILKEKQVWEEKLITFKAKQSESRLIHATTKSLELKINNFVDESKSYDSKIEEIQNAIKDTKTSIQTIYIDLEEYNNVYSHYDKIVTKLNDTATLDLRKNLSYKLGNIIKFISPNKLSKIENRETIEFVNAILEEIVKLKFEQDTTIKEIIESLDVDFHGENINIIKHDAEGKKEEVLEKITKCNKKLQDLNNELNSLNNDLSLQKELKSNIINQYKANLVEFERYKEKLAQLPSDFEIKECELAIKNLVGDIEILENNIKDLNDLKTKISTDIEVKLAEIEKLQTSANEMEEVLKMFDLKKMQQEIDSNRNLLLKSVDEVVALQDKIAEYDNSYAYLTTLIRELESKIHNTNITKEDIVKSENNIALIQNQLNKIIGDIGALQNSIKIQTDNLQMVKELKAEYKNIMKELSTIQKLQDMIGNGALMEYIAEEYMYLITDFANNYVYSISKGKYLLKYDKDFYVLDNFNGGIPRTVKTLSGGERFIISLSLALGISQSIATNNNKSFNFFFIDEGFGSLSESYIDKILQSFDQLIKLNFTVGFITHVEKMKNYITNRIVVSKESNDYGSIVKEEY